MKNALPSAGKCFWAFGSCNFVLVYRSKVSLLTVILFKLYVYIKKRRKKLLVSFSLLNFALVLTVERRKNTRMRIVQTFWCGRANPKEKAYGWPHAEYNLMSWALSCHCLRKYYDDVELYTDSRGYKLLIEELHLPYSKVHVVYDESLCLPHHWAYAKMRTYSMQEEPFVHVDGDVYMVKPFPDSFACASLVAQNREIGTVYYREMMNRILDKSEIRVPEHIVKGIKDDSIASYNMGVFGGTDIGFIRSYCQSAFDFMEENQMNDATKEHANVDCNLLFEQVFFAAKADAEHREVSVLCRPMQDEGYTSRDFCNLTNFDKANFFHVLGGHKQSDSVCYALERVLQRESPTLYQSICNVFRHRHPLLYGRIENLGVETDYPLPNGFIETAKEKWADMSSGQLLQLGRATSTYFRFINLNRLERNDCIVSLNQYAKLWILEHPFCRKRKITSNRDFTSSALVQGLCVVPPVFGANIQVVPISQLGCRILMQVKEKEIRYGDVKRTLYGCFSEKLRKQRKSMNNLFFNEIVYLFYYGILLMKED